MQEREMIAYTTNHRGETVVLWCSPTEDGACTLDVWESKRWLEWEEQPMKSPARGYHSNSPKRA